MRAERAVLGGALPESGDPDKPVFRITFWVLPDDDPERGEVGHEWNLQECDIKQALAWADANSPAGAGYTVEVIAPEDPAYPIWLYGTFPHRHYLDTPLRLA
jgi:hypothetical protein